MVPRTHMESDSCNLSYTHTHTRVRQVPAYMHALNKFKCNIKKLVMFVPRYYMESWLLLSVSMDGGGLCEGHSRVSASE